MPHSTHDAPRTDPYRNFRFVVSWDGRPVAGISEVSGLDPTTDSLAQRKGADRIATPGSTSVSPVTLSRGATHDQAFASWADAAVKVVRKDFNVALFNDAGQKVIAYNLYRCWPSEFVALPAMDPEGNVVAIQKLVLQVEGWERDASVPHPAQFGHPAAG